MYYFCPTQNIEHSCLRQHFSVLKAICDEGQLLASTVWQLRLTWVRHHLLLQPARTSTAPRSPEYRDCSLYSASVFKVCLEVCVSAWSSVCYRLHHLKQVHFVCNLKVESLHLEKLSCIFLGANGRLIPPEPAGLNNRVSHMFLTSLKVLFELEDEGWCVCVSGVSGLQRGNVWPYLYNLVRDM